MADAISDAIINYFNALDNPSKSSENLTRIDKYEFKIQFRIKKTFTSQEL